MAGGVFVTYRIQKKVFGSELIDQDVVPGGAKGLAWASLAFWLTAMTAGRLLAYIGPVAGLA